MTDIHGQAAMRESSEQQFQKGAVWLYFFTIIPWVFDFRAETSGEGALIQASILGIYLIFLFYFIVTYRAHIRSITGVNILIILTLVFLIDGAIASLLNGDSIYAVITSSIPVFVYWTSAFLTAQIVVMTKSSRFSVTALKALCFIFLFSGLFHIMATKGSIDFATSRYQVLGPSTIPALGLIAVVIAASATAFDLMMIMSVVGFVLISVTRTFIVTLVAQFAALGPMSVRLLFSPTSIFRGIMAIVAILVIVALDQFGGIGLTDRWIQRLTASQEFAMDVTYLTRVSEIDYMRDKWLESSEQTFFGNGIAAETQMTGYALALTEQLVGRNSTHVKSFGFGHHNHWSMLYVGGIVAGAPLLLFQFLNAWWSITYLTAERLRRVRERSIDYLGLWGATIVLGTVGMGFLAGTFGNRAGSLWYGIGTGLLLAARSRRWNRT